MSFASDQDSASVAAAKNMWRHGHSQLQHVKCATGISPTGGLHEFFITHGQYDAIKAMYLRVKVAETGGSASVTPVNGFMFYSRIEIVVDGQTASTLYAEDQFDQQSKLTPQQQQYVAATTNQGADYLTPTAIAASGSAVYYIPVWSFLDQCKIAPAGLNHDILLRVYMRESLKASGSGTCAPTAISFELATHKVKTPAEVSRYRTKYNPVQELQYSDCVWNTSGARTITASVQDTVKYQGVNGRVSHINIHVRANPTTNAGLLAHTYLGNEGTIMIIDGANQPALGPDDLDIAYCRYTHAGQHYPGDLYHKLPIIPLIFGEPMAAYAKGAGVGYLDMDRDNLLRYTPGPTFSSGTYTIDQYITVIKKLVIQNGYITRVNLNL